MQYDEFIIQHLRRSADTKENIIKHCIPDIKKVIDVVTEAFRTGHKLLIAGNGGSAADAQHIAAEFVIRLSHDFDRPALPAMALSTDTSILTAGSNDLGYKGVFKRQLEAFGSEGDIFLGISTSGNSENINLAADTARHQQMKTVGLLGKYGGKAKSLFDYTIIVPSDSTQHIQEGHITIGHILCEAVERRLFA